ncbi:MAG TPA: hypothetical protein PKL09_03315 [bacterium]|nr:hypothetical protein [bacterium]HNS34297.1 hypothetical protein [bacterium]HNZ73491.1 hypothetical protein [bacterium]HOH67365.1 hypothetical protein [bacterium]HPW39620.1 hypothetical protein [bacterium]
MSQQPPIWFYQAKKSLDDPKQIKGNVRAWSAKEALQILEKEQKIFYPFSLALKDQSQDHVTFCHRMAVSQLLDQRQNLRKIPGIIIIDDRDQA